MRKIKKPKKEVLDYVSETELEFDESDMELTPSSSPPTEPSPPPRKSKKGKRKKKAVKSISDISTRSEDSHFTDNEIKYSEILAEKKKNKQKKLKLKILEEA